MRTSENKTIINQQLYDTLLPRYRAIIEGLVLKYPIYDGSYYGQLVNFKTNLDEPKHRWYDYKQGFSEMLVRHIIEIEKPTQDYYIIDPFCGVGTTNLTACDMGYKSIGLDISPIAILATKAKTHHYTNKEIITIRKTIENFNLPIFKADIKGGKVLETSFTKDVFDTLLKIRFFVDSIENIVIQRFFRLALISIIDRCSLKIKDGNGLKYRKNYKTVENLTQIFLEKSSEMLSDILVSNANKECKAIFGSLMKNETYQEVKNHEVGLCIFSPPYANCFDYCEVYKLEFWVGGFVKTYSDFNYYRSLAIRSHVNSRFDHQLSYKNNDVDTIASLISTFNIWNKNIPAMLRGYFDDMESFFERLSEILVNNSKCYIVVANSGYKGILVPTDLLLADISRKYNFDVKKIHYTRKLRSSSQQMHFIDSEYNNLMRESIIELILKK